MGVVGGLGAPAPFQALPALRNFRAKLLWRPVG
jgi:hypothetical protein